MVKFLEEKITLVIQSTPLVIIYQTLLYPIVQLVNASHDSCELDRKKKKVP
jgi:hypothetical protein